MEKYIIGLNRVEKTTFLALTELGLALDRLVKCAKAGVILIPHIHRENNAKYLAVSS